MKYYRHSYRRSLEGFLTFVMKSVLKNNAAKEHLSLKGVGDVSIKETRANLRSMSDKELHEHFHRVVTTFHGSDHEQRARFMEKFQGLEVMERRHKRSGSNHIVIPDEETLKIIEDINLDKVDVDSIRLPYDCVALSLPTKGFLLESPTLVTMEDHDATDRLIAVCSNRTSGHYFERYVPGIMSRPLSKVKVLINAAKTREDCLAAYRDGLDPKLYGKMDKHDVAYYAELGDEYAVQLVHEMSTKLRIALQLFVLVQAIPDCLKPGPGYQGVYLDVRPNGKTKKRKGRLLPTFVIELPKRIKSERGAHYCRLHFRSLSHPKFRREDTAGNILPVGEPGLVRIVEVKGHMRGGKVKHVDKNA